MLTGSPLARLNSSRAEAANHKNWIDSVKPEDFQSSPSRAWTGLDSVSLLVWWFIYIKYRFFFDNEVG